MTFAGLLGLMRRVASQLSRVLDDGSEGGIRGSTGVVGAQLPTQAYCQLQKAYTFTNRIEIYIIPETRVRRWLGMEW